MATGHTPCGIAIPQTFPRTPVNMQLVRDFLQKLYDRGEIYQDEYRGFYSTRQEQFLQEKDRLPDGSWPERGIQTR